MLVSIDANDYNLDRALVQTQAVEAHRGGFIDRLDGRLQRKVLLKNDS